MLKPDSYELYWTNDLMFRIPIILAATLTIVQLKRPLSFSLLCLQIHVLHRHGHCY